jgi:hypothetical protein
LTTAPAAGRTDGAQVRHHRFLLGLQTRYGVQIDGALPGALDQDAEAAWRQRVQQAAADCAAGHGPVSVRWPGIEALTVRPDEATIGDKLTGPLIELDAGTRLLSKLDGKGEQTSDAGIAWVWMEDHNEVMRFVPFSSAPLEKKIAQFHDLAGALLEHHGHLAGIVWTRTHRAGGQVRAVTEHTEQGFAMVRALPGGRARESVVIHRRIVLPDQTNAVMRLIDREPEWLDHALARLGYPGGFAALLKKPPTPATALWTPRS